MFENLISGIKHGLLSWYISQPWWRQSFIPSSCKYMYKFFSFFLFINLFITIFFNLSINLLRVFLCFNCCTHEVINTYYSQEIFISNHQKLNYQKSLIFTLKFNETCQKNHLSPFSLKKGTKTPLNFHLYHTFISLPTISNLQKFNLFLPENFSANCQTSSIF